MAELDLSNLPGAPVCALWSYRSGSALGALNGEEWVRLRIPLWARYVSVRCDTEGATLLVGVGVPVRTYGGDGVDPGTYQAAVPVFGSGSPVTVPVGPNPQLEPDDERCAAPLLLARQYPLNAVCLWGPSGTAYSLSFSRYL